MRIAFVHPDLGIGGAERLIVDAAVGLQRIKGHSVIIYTSYHSPDHCFPETLSELHVVVRGRLWNPFKTHLLLPFAIARQLILSFSLVLEQLLFTTPDNRVDCFVVDQLSASIPMLRAIAPVFFYGHYPDKLLSRRSGWLKRLYRLPLDWLEEWTTKQADMIVANSEFTASVFQRTFSGITLPKVLHPAIQLSAYDSPVDMADPLLTPLKTSGKRLIVSINRFERKKSIELAIYSFFQLRSSLESSEEFSRLQLVIAGGYDPRVEENVSYHAELQRLAASLQFSHSTFFATSGETAEPAATDILFLPSFSNNQRSYLLSNALMLLYTPSNEHFGIVPLEAMYCGVPVIAVGSGGPLETIRHGWNGWLCEDIAAAKINASDGDNHNYLREMSKDFAKWMLTLVRDDFDNDGSLRNQMGQRGKHWVQERFDLKAFTERLDSMLKQMMTDRRNPWWHKIGLFLLIVVPFLTIIYI